MKFPIPRFIAFLTLAFIVSIIVHESIHILQAKMHKAEPEEVCFLGYSKEGAAGWVVADVEDWKGEKAFFKYELPTIIVTAALMFLIAYIMIWWDLKYY